MDRKRISQLLVLSLLLFATTPAFSVVVRCGGIPGNGSTSRVGVYHNKGKQLSDEQLMNLKSKVGQILEQTSKKHNKNVRFTSSVPMSLTAAEMNAFSSPRSSWLTLLDKDNLTSMDIGAADLNNPQTWTLPANFLNEVESYYNEDFVPLAEVPEDLRFEEANKVIKSEYKDSADNTIEVYEHYIMDNTDVEYIGVSYYFYLDEDEDAFDATDYKFTDIPMQLDDEYTYQVQEDETDFRNLRYIESTKKIDGFGTLNTPYGAFDCLRMTFTVNQYTRSDINSPYENDLTNQFVGFVTDKGHYFIGRVSGLSGIVNMDEVEFRVVAPTGILQDQSEVQINNDANGVLISNTGVYIDVLTKTADENAILDIESDDKGIMIPRLEMAKRPATPNTGLLIYQTDNTPGFYYYDGSAWTRLDNTTPSAAARIAAPSQSHSKAKSIYKKGFGTLENGTAFIPLKVSNGMSPEELMIQLQAEGECNGLYISKKTNEGFEVKELNNGKSNIRFSWNLNQL